MGGPVWTRRAAWEGAPSGTHCCGQPRARRSRPTITRVASPASASAASGPPGTKKLSPAGTPAAAPVSTCTSQLRPAHPREEGRFALHADGRRERAG